MKHSLLLSLCTLLFLSFAFAQQDCSISIGGGSCTGNDLRAITSGNALAHLTWFQYTNNVFEADTISSQSSKSIVAGNNGSGSGANQFGFPGGGITVDAAGNVYVADTKNNRIQKWAPGASTGVTIAGGNGGGSGPSQLANPMDVFVDAAGNIYIADAANHRVQRWAPGATSGITVAGGNGAGSNANQLNGPRAVFADNNGNVLVADTYNYRIQLWRRGAVAGTTVAGGNGYGTGPNQFTHPLDIYADAAKNMYIADANTENSAYHRVQKWKLGETSGVTVAGNFGYLLAIYVDAAGNLYTADNGISGAPVSLVKKWAPGTTHGVTVAGGHPTGWDVLSYPTGVTLDKQGNIYVLDGTYNPRVQKYIHTNGIVDTTFTPSQPGQYSVRAIYKNGCTATSSSILVRAIPAAPEIYSTIPKGNSNLCDGGTRTFFVNNWDGATNYNWQIPATCSLVANINDSIIIAVPAGFNKGALRAAGSNTCGTGQAGVLALLDRPALPGYIKGPRQVSPNQQGVIYSIANASSSLEWKAPTDAVIVAGQGSTSITVNWGSTPGIVGVSAYNDCGASPFKELQVALRASVVHADAAAATSTTNNGTGVFPNPAKHMVNVKFNAGKQANYTVELQSLNGTVLYQKNIGAQKGINSIPIDVTNYASGLYIVNVKNAGEKISFKLVKH